VKLDNLAAIPSALCVVTVRGSQVIMPQPFSLVISGPLTARHGCEAPSQISSPPCVHGTLGSTGVTVTSQQGLVSAWGCVCDELAFGPLCAQRSTELGLPVVAGGASVEQRQIRTWQWEFFGVDLCGPGIYELELEHEQDDDVSSAASGLLLTASTVVSSAAGASVSSAAGDALASMWSSDSASESVHSNVPLSWEEQGLKFEVSSAMAVTSNLGIVPHSGKVRRTVMTVQLSSSSDTVKSLQVSVFSRSRGGASTIYGLRWQQIEVLGSISLGEGCPSSAEVAAALALRNSRGSVDGGASDQKNSLPGALLALLVTLGLLCALVLCVGAAVGLGVAPSSRCCFKKHSSSAVADADSFVDAEAAVAETGKSATVQDTSSLPQASTHVNYSSTPLQTSIPLAGALPSVSFEAAALHNGHVPHQHALPTMPGPRAAAQQGCRTPPRPPKRPPPARGSSPSVSPSP